MLLGAALKRSSVIFLALCCIVDAWTVVHHSAGRSSAPDSMMLCRHSATISSRRRRITTSLHDTPSTIADSNNVRIYSRPSLYDLAFGYRDFDQEVQTLLELHRCATDEPAQSVLELAAGPARHSLAVPRSTITKYYAIDCSVEMKEYSDALMRTAAMTDMVEYLVQDMRKITLPTSVDTAWLLLGSLQHMVTVSDAIQCFRSVHTSLNANGTFILELPHPNEVFSMVDCTTNTWTVPLEVDDGSDGELNIVWGHADDPFDPISHIRNATVGFRLTTGHNDTEQWNDSVPMKVYTVPELYLLADLTGFRVVRLLGALDNPDELVPIDNEDLAYRLVCVLQKKG